MKRIFTVVTVLAFLLTACTGDPGPPGPPGDDGGIIVSDAFEIEINFNADNNFEYIEPYGFDVFPYDVTLVYIEWEIDNGNSVWRLLPQNVYFEDGTLVYNYDYTQQDVRFFLDGTVNLNNLDASWTQNQVFRVVVIPADNVDNINIADLGTVMQIGNIDKFELR